MAAIDHRLASGEHGHIHAVRALFEMASRAGPVDILLADLAINDLTLLDGALATLAQTIQMPSWTTTRRRSTAALRRRRGATSSPCARRSDRRDRTVP